MSELKVAEFGLPGALRDALVQAIMEGTKTATSSLLADYEASGEPLPVVGEHQVVLDSDSRPVAVIEVTAVDVVPLARVGLAHAMDEGEGYLSVAQWRAAHERFWRALARELDVSGVFDVDDQTLVVLERFILVGGA